MLVHIVAPSGGIEAALVDLTQALIAAGHRVRVYACRPFDDPNQNVERLRSSGADVSACPGWLARVAGLPEITQARIFYRLLDISTPLLIVPGIVNALVSKRPVRRSVRGLRGVISGWVLPRLRLERLFYLPLDLSLWRRRPDVVHLHGWGCGIDPPGGLTWSASRLLPSVYTEHNSPPESVSSAVRSWLSLADAVIACSQAGARGLRAGCNAAGPIKVIPYSVADPTTDIEFEAQPHESASGWPVTITCLARLSQQHKGQDILLHAVKSVIERAPGTLLLMAGDGESRGELEALTAELGIGDAVRFLGQIPRLRLAWLMAQSDILVLPSRWEGLPVSIIESMAFGKPVVASEAGGNPELIEDGVTGLIVPIGDIEALVEALLELVNDPRRRLKMGAAARRRFDAGTFSPEIVAEATLAVYRMVLADRNALTDRNVLSTMPVRGDASSMPEIFEDEAR